MTSQQIDEELVKIDEQRAVIVESITNLYGHFHATPELEDGKKATINAINGIYKSHRENLVNYFELVVAVLAESGPTALEVVTKHSQ